MQGNIPRNFWVRLNPMYLLQMSPTPCRGCMTPVDDSEWTRKRIFGLCLCKASTISRFLILVPSGFSIPCADPPLLFENIKHE